jgi:hypothetical protein
LGGSARARRPWDRYATDCRRSRAATRLRVVAIW